MNNDRLKFRTPYYLPGPDDKDEFVNFCHWNAIDGRPSMMVTWGKDEQCTGLRDKSGNLIYENDVLKVLWYGGRYLYFVVEWYSDLMDEVCGFELHETNETGKLLDPTRLSSRKAINIYILDHCEIISNIHEQK